MKVVTIFAALIAGILFVFEASVARDMPESAIDKNDAWHWTIDEAASALTFSGTQTGKSFSGEFKEFTAEITLNPSDLSDARIVVKVQTQSARTGDRQRDAAIPGSDWFDAKEHPLAVFTSQKISRQSDGSYIADGELSIRGAKKQIQLPFDLSITDGRAKAEGTLSLIRTDYGVGQGEFSTGQWVGLDVSVAYKIEAAR